MECTQWKEKRGFPYLAISISKKTSEGVKGIINMAIVKRTKVDGSSSFQVRVKDPEGKWFEASTYDNKEDALHEELRLLSLKKKGSRAASEDAKKITLNEYWAVWSKENRTEVSEGWKISQDQMYRDYVKPILGDLIMIKIGPPEIGRVLNRAKEKGRSTKTRSLIYTLMRKMFNDAVEYYDMLDRCPVRSKLHRPKITERKRNFLLPVQAWLSSNS
jgi:hypothetical protein